MEPPKKIQMKQSLERNPLGMSGNEISMTPTTGNSGRGLLRAPKLPVSFLHCGRSRRLSLQLDFTQGTNCQGNNVTMLFGQVFEY